MKLGKDDITGGGILKATPSNIPEWLKTIREIIPEINKMLAQYNTMRGVANPQNTKGLTGNSSGGISIEKALAFAELFVANLQKQGYGEMPIAQVLTQIPTTVNQAAEGLQKLKAKRIGGVRQ